MPPAPRTCFFQLLRTYERAFRTFVGVVAIGPHRTAANNRGSRSEAKPFTVRSVTCTGKRFL
jgi:hypothetical protein